MNDLHHPCKTWAERISLAASGCLSPTEESEVLRHVETCPGCRERFRQLTELCGTLARVELPSVDTDSIVARAISAIDRPAEIDTETIHPIDLRKNSEPFQHQETRKIRPIRPHFAAAQEVTTNANINSFLTRSLNYWRWMMRSPVSRVAAAAIFLVAIIGTVLWFQGVGATPAFAEVAQQILDMKSAKFLESNSVENLPGDKKPRLTFPGGGHVEVLWSAPNRYYRACKEGDKIRQTTVVDFEKQKSMNLFPDHKYAFVTEYRNSDNKGIIAKIREILQKAKKDPKVESLGEKEIDGHHVIGYRVKEKGTGRGPRAKCFDILIDIWADSKTSWPVYIEESRLLPNGVVSKTTLSQFEYNIKVDESLFKMKPPAEYEVQYELKDDAPYTEKDLLELLRIYAEQNDRNFPEVLSYKKTWKSFGLKNVPITKPGKELDKQQIEKMKQTTSTIFRGFCFFDELPAEADAHYAGKDVTLGESDKPILWYRPKGSDNYRVIYGDLSVKELAPAEIKKFPKGDPNQVLKMKTKTSTAE